MSSKPNNVLCAVYGADRLFLHMMLLHPLAVPSTSFSTLRRITSCQRLPMHHLHEEKHSRVIVVFAKEHADAVLGFLPRQHLESTCLLASRPSCRRAISSNTCVHVHVHLHPIPNIQQLPTSGTRLCICSSLFCIVLDTGKHMQDPVLLRLLQYHSPRRRPQRRRECAHDTHVHVCIHLDVIPHI